MSSAPAVDLEFQVTVKRVPGGLVSNWLIDEVAVGDLVEVSTPSGFFQLAPVDNEIVAFSAGSGITPIFSLLKAALATTDRRVRLLYANRDQASVIFASALDELERFHPRLTVAHHLDAARGFVDAEAVRGFVGTPGTLSTTSAGRRRSWRWWSRRCWRAVRPFVPAHRTVHSGRVAGSASTGGADGCRPRHH